MRQEDKEGSRNKERLKEYIQSLDQIQDLDSSCSANFYDRAFPQKFFNCAVSTL